MPPLTAVALVSAAALAFEVLLVRLLSIAQWHHFAHMIISMALLGYGASGTALAIHRRRAMARPALNFAICAALFAVSAPLSFALSQLVPLNVLELAWDPWQWGGLAVVYLVLAVPFLCAGAAVGLALIAAGDGVGRVYRSDLVGAGAGAVGVVAALFVVDHETALKLTTAAALLAAALAARRAGMPIAAAALAGAVVLALLAPGKWIAPQPSPYKGLPVALSVPDAAIVAERSGPLGWLTVVESPTIPFRHAPGLGLTAPAPPPEQRAVFTDAGGMTAITRWNGDASTLAYLDHQTAALPFHLRRRPSTLIIGAGGGADVLLAWFHQAPRIDAVEVNGQLVSLVRDTFGDFDGHIYDAPGVTVHVTEGRSFLRRTPDRFDIITVSLLDSFTAAAAGLHALHESTLYTVEAFDSAFDVLEPSGLLAVTRWLKLPPRDTLKLIATAATALERRGVTEPGRHLALIRGWQTATLIASPSPLSATDVAAVRRFSRDRGFDVAWLPGIEADEVNRRSVLERPYVYEGAAALLGPDREKFLLAYRFDVRPATDDRPYFFHFVKPSTLLELLADRRGGAWAQIEWGYPVLLATIMQAVLAGIAFVLLPLAFARGTGSRPWPRAALLTCFGALGFAFLFVEIAFIQRFQLFLGHPLYAVAVSLAGFLVFAGLGSGAAATWCRACGSPVRAMAAAVAAIVLLTLTYVHGLAEAFDALAAAPRGFRIAAAIGFTAPLAFCMGMPFPLALADVSRRAPDWAPWAWGINGAASVVAATVAAIVAIQWGFAAVVSAAAGLYVVAALAFAATGPGR